MAWNVFVLISRPRLISKEILIDLFRGPAWFLTCIQGARLAQTLIWWKHPKGQILFKWHFDDISLACLTFGEFRFFCALHLIHADPLLIRFIAKQYFHASSPIILQTPSWKHECITTTDKVKKKYIRRLKYEHKIDHDLSTNLNFLLCFCLWLNRCNLTKL